MAVPRIETASTVECRFGRVTIPACGPKPDCLERCISSVLAEPGPGAGWSRRSAGRPLRARLSDSTTTTTLGRRTVARGGA